MAQILDVYTIPFIFKRSLKNNPNNNFLSFTDETPLTYIQVSYYVSSLINYFEEIGLKKNDKVAILSGNMPNWGIVYLATTNLGLICVPILPDFTAEEITNVLEHSEAKVLFISELQIPKAGHISTPYLKHKIKINDFSTIESESSAQYKFIEEEIKDYNVQEDDLCSIIYTSGTTGKSKGVMLTHRNIAFNAEKSGVLQPIFPNDRFLSLLPMSHTYENTLGFILPMIHGASVYYMKKLPTPAVLLPAMKQIRPTLMLAVPLIIEKIYRQKIISTINAKALTRNLYKVPFLRKLINKSAGKKLIETFGGEIRFFGIGGSKLDAVVEKFLIEAKFPYAIGYGLTETAPLVAGVNPNIVRHQSTGPIIEGIEVKLDNINPKTNEGEILVKGPNVMKGYYKDIQATEQVLTDDGWFRTGDLGFFDKDNFLYIKGRLKNVIVGPSGENIYPEEIEALINNFNFVVESLVVEEKGKLVALVHFNKEELENKYKDLKGEVTDYIDKKIEELSQELKLHVNTRVNSFSTLKMVVAHANPFEKTATQKIKRYKYYNV